MDPFSITVGIVGLVDGGLSLSKDLKDKIDTFKNAEREVMELAHEVDLCTTLLDIFGSSLDRPEISYAPNVVKQTQRLVLDMRTIFDEIAALIQGFDTSTKASAKYVVNAGAPRGQHSKLKGLQLSFVFMLSVCPPQQQAPTPSINVAGMGSGALGRPGSFEGTIQHVPVYGSSRDPSSNVPVTYKATLTLHPTSSGQSTAGSPAARTPDPAQAPDLTQQLEGLRRNERLKKKLANLTSNPFFSKDLFGDMFSSWNTRAGAATKQSVPQTRSSRKPRPSRQEAEQAFRRKVSDDRPVEYSYTEPMLEDVDPNTELDSSTEIEYRSTRDADDILSYLFDEGESEQELHAVPAAEYSAVEAFDDGPRSLTEPPSEQSVYSETTASGRISQGYGIPELPQQQARMTPPAVRPSNSLPGQREPRQPGRGAVKSHVCDGCETKVKYEELITAVIEGRLKLYR